MCSFELRNEAPVPLVFSFSYSGDPDVTVGSRKRAELMPDVDSTVRAGREIWEYRTPLVYFNDCSAAADGVLPLLVASDGTLSILDAQRRMRSPQPAGFPQIPKKRAAP